MSAGLFRQALPRCCPPAQRLLCCALFVSAIVFAERSSAQQAPPQPRPAANTPAPGAAPAPAEPNAAGAQAQEAGAEAAAPTKTAADTGPSAEPDGATTAPRESMADTAARARARAALLHAQARQREWEARARARARRGGADLDDRDDDGSGSRIRGDAGAPLALGFQVVLPWNTDPSYDVFSEDDVSPRLGAFIAYDLVSLQPDLIFAGEIGWAIDTAESTLFQRALDTEMEQHWFHAGATLRWVLWPWLQPHARVQGGVSWTDVEFSANGTSFEDDAFAPFGNLGAGVLLRTPTRLFENRRGSLASLSFGVLLEGGYTLAAPVGFELDGPGPGKNDIALDEASLGELRRSGPFARASLVARF